MSKIRLVWLAYLVLSIFTPEILVAAELPSYAQGQDLKQEVESKGENITDILTLIVSIICILGIAWGAMKIGMGEADDGKKFVGGGVVGLIIISVIYGIAALAAG